MENSVISKMECAIKDFKMLQDETWQPDNDSCQASIDNMQEAIYQLRDNALWLNKFIDYVEEQNTNTYNEACKYADEYSTNEERKDR
tara:strand:+ start:1517 stop:1777 length:261 start_codon:yes stop_codon:yes gene_type:complete